MRTVRDAAWMQRDRAALNTAARSEVSTHIKEHFVGFDIIVHPRNFHGLGMGIEETRCECANNVPTNLKRLMNGRRLMDRAGNRLEILGVERERIEITIPAHRIEGMMR